jgi:hypothetical protein
MVYLMDTHNSLDVYTSITLRLHRDIAERYPNYDNFSILRDAEEIRHRVSKEGIGFLTKTLPSVGKAIDLALQDERPLLTPAFQKNEGELLPKFLGKLLERCFSRRSAMVLDSIDTNALRDLRTLTYFSYKLEIPYDQKTEKSVLESYIQTEKELHSLEFPQSSDPIINDAAYIIGRVFDGFDVGSFRSRHGPGVVATGEIPPEKFNFSRRYRALEFCFPYKENFFLNARHYEAFSHWRKTHVTELCAGTSKVVPVPKDSRGPRLISSEPLEYQFIQQGIMRSMISHLESTPLTRGFVNFTNQEINRQLALMSSDPTPRPFGTIRWEESRLTDMKVRVKRKRSLRVPNPHEWVTLDMKDASDRVSLKLVERLFWQTSLLWPLKGSRSTTTQLPDGRTVTLAKFAPMGSAVCFPVEATCFWALSVAAIMYRPGFTFAKARKRVFVYGDDIIVRREDYPTVIQHLEAVGLKVNRDKSCVSGFFRESCGCDAYKGVDVTPIRLRKTWCSHGEPDPTQLVSYVSLSNSLRSRGYERAGTYVMQLVEGRYGPLPYVPYEVTVDADIPSPKNAHSTSRLIGFARLPDRYNPPRPSDERTPSRWNPDYHVRERWGWVVKPVYQMYRVNHWNELYRKLACNTRIGTVGVYAVPHRSRLKRGWGG